MALPSPCFVKNSIKPIAPEKKHVTKDEVKQSNHFIAYCKVCREGFSSENLLFQHRKTHDKCPYDDCKFNASSKVIAEHVQRVHIKSNSLVKIQDLTTPEQIEKWREERRKRYPSSANVLLRQQAKEARVERGEKLQDRQTRFGDSKQKDHPKNFNNRNHQKQDQKNSRYNNKQFQKNNRRDFRSKPRNNVHHDRQQQNQSKDDKDKVIPQTLTQTEDSFRVVSSTNNDLLSTNNAPRPRVIQQQNDESSDEECRAIPRFKGTSMMKDYHTVKTIVQEKAALSILGMYGSDSEIEMEVQVEAAADKTSEPEVSKAEKVELIEKTVEKREEEVAMSEDEHEAPEEVPIEHNDEGVLPAPNLESPEKLSRKRRQEYQQSQRVVRQKPRSGLDYSKLRTMSSVNPFLEKLLQQDIRHERNVLLQCVNYVVRNNFFDPPQGPSPEPMQALTKEEVTEGVAVESEKSTLVENIESQ